MSLEKMISEITKRWEDITTELVHRKRIDPKTYEDVVSALARLPALERERDDHGTTLDDPNSFK